MNPMLDTTLDLAAAYPGVVAVMVGVLVIWMKLSKRTRRRVRRWIWRKMKRSARWGWRRVSSPGTPATRQPDTRQANWTWPVEEGGATVLYRHYDSANRLLYVGITDAKRGGRRWQEHQADKAWFPLVARSEVSRPYPTRADALYAEACAIRDENPVHNICRPDPNRVGRRD